MFSVNVDKLIKMTETEAKSYKEIVDNILDKAGTDLKSLAVIGGGLSSFKLAAQFMELGKRVLFVDANLDADVFIGKYKIGKDLNGFTDFILDSDDTQGMICVTNREKLDVIFTGNIDLVDESMITSEIMDKFFHAFSSKYDYIILQSDKEGDVAQFCDATVIVTEQEQYNEIASELRVSELDKKGCFVLGVVIDE